MIGNCDACDRQNVPVSKVNVPGEPTACFLCQGDSNPDPYCETADEYVLMPREATREMTMAGCDSLPSCEHVFGHAGEILRNAYRKMVEVGGKSQAPGSRSKPSPWDLTVYQKLRATPSNLNDARAAMNGAASEIDRLYNVLEELAAGFESARDRCNYAAEAQRLDNCAKFCRSHTLPRVTPAKKPDGCEPCSWPECGCQGSAK